MTLVVDASATVAVLIEKGPTAGWVADRMRTGSLAAPAVMPFEVGGVIRRRARHQQLDATTAALAHRSLSLLNIDLWPHALVAERAWDLRDTVTYDDACFVALAEMLEAPLLTLDARLARAPGPRCEFVVPPTP